jgi:hypothetical protein
MSIYNVNDSDDDDSGGSDNNLLPVKMDVPVRRHRSACKGAAPPRAQPPTFDIDELLGSTSLTPQEPDGSSLPLPAPDRDDFSEHLVDGDFPSDDVSSPVTAVPSQTSNCIPDRRPPSQTPGNRGIRLAPTPKERPRNRLLP